MTRINMKKLASDYAIDRTAVKKCAEEYGISIQAVYYQMERAGINRRLGGDSSVGTQARENNPNWSGGVTQRRDGYLLEYVNGKRVFQHRLVAEKMLGRRLVTGECVHHKNGVRSDNRPENLDVLPSHSDHMKHHCPSDVMRERGRKGNIARYGALKARESGNG